MPQVGWIEALRRWNVGGTSWCIPRKGTPGYDTVMRIRHGEPVKVKEHVKEIERKEKRSMTINLNVEVPAAKPVRRKIKAMVPTTPKSKE